MKDDATTKDSTKKEADNEDKITLHHLVNDLAYTTEMAEMSEDGSKMREILHFFIVDEKRGAALDTRQGSTVSIIDPCTDPSALADYTTMEDVLRSAYLLFEHIVLPNVVAIKNGDGNIRNVNKYRPDYAIEMIKQGYGDMLLSKMSTDSVAVTSAKKDEIISIIRFINREIGDRIREAYVSKLRDDIQYVYTVCVDGFILNENGFCRPVSDGYGLPRGMFGNRPIMCSRESDAKFYVDALSKHFSEILESAGDIKDIPEPPERTWWRRTADTIKPNNIHISTIPVVDTDVSKSEILNLYNPENLNEGQIRQILRNIVLGPESV